MDQQDAPMTRIAIIGAGLAGQICAAALRANLPSAIDIKWLDTGRDQDSDIFYGHTTPPESYGFNLAACVNEPDLVLNSDTSFSLGTQFTAWSPQNLEWVQCSHLPLPVMDSVPFHHHLARLDIDNIEPFLMPSIMARNGRFAHPPPNTDTPLSRAEYGYQIDPFTYGRVFQEAATQHGLVLTNSAIEAVCVKDGHIRSIALKNGEKLTADLFIDCTGPKASLLHALGSAYQGKRALFGASSYQAQSVLGFSCRHIHGTDYGWVSESALQGRRINMSVSAPEDKAAARAAHNGAVTTEADVMLGRRDAPWLGNCVGIGHAAAILEPISTAPIRALQRDIERLLRLIPVSADMSVERREYNRLFDDDISHMHMFNRSFFPPGETTPSLYWKQASEQPLGEKLTRKLTLFEDRGVLVTYDLEPFNEQDWTILHFGMRRTAGRYDRVADRYEKRDLERYLNTMSQAIKTLAAKIPPHHIYMQGLRKHLSNRPS